VLLFPGGDYGPYPQHAAVLLYSGIVQFVGEKLICFLLLSTI